MLRDKHDGALTDRLDVRVWLRLFSCSTVVEKRLRRRLADRFATTLPRFDVLAALERTPNGVAMGELSRSLLVSNGNVTTIVRQLEADGLVVARIAQDDRRSSLVALTDKGRADFLAMATAHHDWINAAFSGLTKKELRSLFELLDRLRQSIAADGDLA